MPALMLFCEVELDYPQGYKYHQGSQKKSDKEAELELGHELPWGFVDFVKKVTGEYRFGSLGEEPPCGCRKSDRIFALIKFKLYAKKNT